MHMSHPNGTAELESVLRVLHDDRLKRLARYWFDKRGARLVTRRDDIDPLEMPWILPFVWLYDYESDTGRFRCRLAGEEVRVMYRMNIVGRYLDEFILAKSWPRIDAHYRGVVETPAIGHAIGQVYLTSLDRSGIGERVVMPLSDSSGETVTMLLGATAYRDVRGLNPQEHIDRALFPLSPAS